MTQLAGSDDPGWLSENVTGLGQNIPAVATHITAHSKNHPMRFILFTPDERHEDQGIADGSHSIRS
jgi:hypothetical protein